MKNNKPNDVSIGLLFFYFKDKFIEVSGASLVVVLTTLSSMGLPLEGMAFIAGIDRVLDMLRTAVNVVGNALASIVMSKSVGLFDKEKAKNYSESIKQQTVS
ncbi:Na+/H+-dicarboxylate symporter [Neobacillus ginsengisoli]|uniref:Na+/H+-dicarboxylate symporter n=1 Tax=Neobacillus ginsengisoli TaxID=904295 RepID=A0ABT9XUU9_9BACI|nr:Na+/H+-dicarboxylate symporter [Neobacillus ginsengisoli]